MFRGGFELPEAGLGVRMLLWGSPVFSVIPDVILWYPFLGLIWVLESRFVMNQSSIGVRCTRIELPLASVVILGSIHKSCSLVYRVLTLCSCLIKRALFTPY